MDRSLMLASKKKKKDRSFAREKRSGENRELGLERETRKDEVAMDKNSITLIVNLGSLTPTEPLTLDGFKSSDTISYVKARVCQTAMDLGLHPLNADIRSLMSPQGPHLEDNQTLASAFHPGCQDEILILYYFIDAAKKRKFREPKADMRWLPICKLVRFREEAHEDNVGSYEYGYPILIEKRPKSIYAPLPFAQVPDLGIHGQYELLDVERRPITLSKIMHTHSVATTASVVLLALNDRILKDLVSSNSESEYLVIRVSWDKLSYFFVRLLRTAYPDIPIVAVTDLDPHHLDLLTFLDTPPEFLPSCYGWDLTRDFKEDVCSSDLGFANIKWLGLRPFDFRLPRLDSLKSGTSRCPGFDKVISMLRANPFLRKKKEWLEALDWLGLVGKCVSLHLLAPPLDSVVVTFIWGMIIFLRKYLMKIGFEYNRRGPKCLCVSDSLVLCPFNSYAADVKQRAESGIRKFGI
ncbi:unnamed protein product [Cuscuta campestris]|uniref:Uncharacterized protein n=1 Tax=Cuscuta campestris TaxID=132261 RepID=A0A484NG33_9ASTE|nr:unnamed protein product [Cuscuta campestris]